MKIIPQTVSKAINASLGKFDPFRKARGRFLSQMTGRFYGNAKGKDKDDKRASPLNLLHSAVTTLVPNLVYNEPKVKTRTEIILYRQYSEMLELATNFLINRIDLRMTLRKAIYDAIFMAGFVKTGLATNDQFLDIEGTTVEIGQPYAERVDPDDIILDPWARDWDEQSFIGNRFRANLDDMLATGLYDPDELTRLSKVDDKKRQASRLDGGEPAGEFMEIQRYIDLCEVYFPREQVIVTLPYYVDGRADQFLRIADYNGPSTGPYHMLGFTPVSDNLLPVAPASIWYDLHILGNRIARKLARQAERLKRVLAYQGEAQEDVEEIADADDGETVRVSDVGMIKELTFGGAAPESYQWMDWVKRNFSEQAGNIDQLAGAASDVPTLGQSEMLQANTSVRLGDMQGMVYHFAAAIARDLAFYLHTDPLIDLPLTKRTGDGGEQQVFYTPEMREGTFFDYTFKVEPYSMARPDPNMAVRRKLEFATSVIPAATQAAMMLGPGFNVGAFLKSMAREVQLEEAGEWLNDPMIQQWIMQKIQMSMATGDPGKAGQQAGVPQQGAAPFNPQQPVPTATGPTGGITPDTEQNMAQQETSGELQSVNGRSQQSTKSLAAGKI